MRRLYCVVFPDKSEYTLEINYNPETFNAKHICEFAAGLVGLKNHYKNIKVIATELFQVELVRGQFTRRFVGNYEIVPTVSSLTEEEVQAEMGQLEIKDFPREWIEYAIYQKYLGDLYLTPEQWKAVDRACKRPLPPIGKLRECSPRPPKS